MALHQAQSTHAVGSVGRVGPHAAFRLLEEDGEDEAPVEDGGFGNMLDGVEDLEDFLRGVVWYAPVVGTARNHDYTVVKSLPVIEIGQIKDERPRGYFLSGLTSTCMRPIVLALASLAQDFHFLCKVYTECSL